MSVTQIAPHAAYEELKKNKNAVLVDVRTFEEFNFVGFVDPASFDGRMILLPWQLYPEMEENLDFAHNLTKSLAQLSLPIDKACLFFICRTGARSNAAAEFALNSGYENPHNILHGFEGDLNSGSHRGLVNGWKASNLPWRQK